MRRAARISLAVVLFLGGLMLLPADGARLLASDALAQVPTPLPTLPTLPGSPSPSPSESSTPDDGSDDEGDEPSEHDDQQSGDGGGGNDTGGGASGRDKTRHEDGEGGFRKNGKGAQARDGRGSKPGDRKGVPGGGMFVGTLHPSGSFDTDELVAVAAQLQALGRSRGEVLREVYAPFIIGGEAAWTNTWGAPRYGPAPGQVRTHEGQDVFCTFGAPVLASQAGKIEFDRGGLGGLVARLYRGDGSYWYYAHLSGYNTEDFESGDRVEPGDVIGYCGNSGNALTTPPHVHFGWYQGNGKAKDPHWALLRWLRAAERRADRLVAKTMDDRVQRQDRFTMARLFGDWAAPDLAEIDIAGESLWASGATPASGTFALAEAALQAALGDGDLADVASNDHDEVAADGAGAAYGHRTLESSGPVSAHEAAD